MFSVFVGDCSQQVKYFEIVCSSRWLLLFCCDVENVLFGSHSRMYVSSSSHDLEGISHWNNNTHASERTCSSLSLFLLGEGSLSECATQFLVAFYWYSI